MRMGLKRKMMKNMMPKEFGAISGLFHAGIFTLQSKAIEAWGKSIFKETVFPEIEKAITKMPNLGIQKVEGENPEDFMKRFIEVLKDSMLVENAFLRKKSETEFIFTLIDCFMAGPAHKIAGKNGICPMAMVVAAMVEKYLDKEVNPEFSRLTPVGSITKINISDKK